MSTWFTADHHFGHRMIIKYERRHENIAGLTPDDMDIKIMDEFMIKQWNTFIEPDDVVYHLGDFALHGREYKKSILEQLNGYKIIIIGNHDTGCKSMKDLGFDEAHRYLGLEIETYTHKARWLLVHTAYPYFGTSHWWDSIVCGHVHGGNYRHQINQLPPYRAWNPAPT